MDNLDEFLENNHRKEDLALIRKWFEDYIVPFDKEEVTWLNLTSEELKEFLDKNYLDSNKYVGWNNSFLYNVLGMQYLGYINIIPGFKYLIGVIPNKIDKFTIVASLCYDTDHFFELNQTVGVNWIQMVETNVFYQNNGLFNQICKMLPSYIDYSKDLILTDESTDGMKYHTHQKIGQALVEKGFSNEVLSHSEVGKEYIKKITR